MELRGRRVLVTGASRGIGEALARAFAGAGSDVVVLARSEGPLKDLAAAIGATAYPADLTDADTLDGLIGRIEATAGPIDVLVNNAGIDATGGFLSLSAHDVDTVIRLNFLTPIELCRQVLPGMLERGRGHIVNVSSLAGVGAFPGMVTYSATKAGLTHFTAGLRADLKGRPVGTTVVELGPVPTDMLDHVDSYEPTARSFARFERLRLLTDVDRDVVARTVVDAVRAGKGHVRHPKRAAAFALLTESPRRITELLLTAVPHQPR